MVRVSYVETLISGRDNVNAFWPDVKNARGQEYIFQMVVVQPPRNSLDILLFM